MKRCPYCNDITTYSDDDERCPVCNSILVRDTYLSSNEVNSGEEIVEPVHIIVPSLDSNVDESVRNNELPVFENNGTYRGRVSFVHSNSRFHNRFKKVIYAIFRGEPYQFGNSSHETIIRLEEINPGHISRIERDFVLYGDVEGRIGQGDDVTIVARRRGDRNVITSLYSNSVESYIRPEMQLPSWIFSGGFGIVILLILLLILSGEILNVIIYFAVLYAVILFLRGLFRRRW